MRVCVEPRMEGRFFATDEHGFSRIIAGGMLGFVLNHEWTRMDTNGHESARINVARAFQPEICPAGAVQLWNVAGCWSHAKPLREMHNFEVPQASRGRESAGVRMREAAGARVIVVPAAADALLDQMGIAADARDSAALDDADWFARLAAGGFAVGQPVPIFPRLDLPEGDGEGEA